MKDKPTHKNILIVAAEESSALYAQRLLDYWVEHQEPVKAFGVGSEAMREVGFEVLGRSEDLSVVGLHEIISQWSHIRSTFHALVEHCQQHTVSCALLLDYPGFNLRLAR